MSRNVKTLQIKRINKKKNKPKPLTPIYNQISHMRFSVIPLTTHM